MSLPSERAPWTEDDRPPEDWLAAVDRETRRGELLAAVDLAERGLTHHPEDHALAHRAVLALARAGATEEAQRRFDKYRLGHVADEDIASLRARIAKDVALAAEGRERRSLAAHAAELYGAVFAQTGGYYPAINAATLWLIAGRTEQAQSLAQGVLDLLRSVSDQSYYALATAAEAELLLGDVVAARTSLRRAADRHHGDFGAVGTTRRQLRSICEVLGLDTDLLRELRVPAVAHFCGHRIGADGLTTRFGATSEQVVAARVAEVVKGESIGFAYGSLAAGADILWAEALLDLGSEVHVVLPFALAEFVRVSVEPSGAAWTERFHRCLARATSVHYATEDAFLGDDVLFRYCSELGMGLALLRARYLDADVHQLAVWDGEPSDGLAGTAVDIATWRRHARGVTVVSPTPDGRTYSLAGSSEGQPAPGSQSVPHRDGSRVSPRVVRAMLFADVAGFSRLTDELLPVFADSFLGAFAATVDRYQGDVWHRNTWGDALYVVLTDARTAASCALDLQEAVAAIDLELLGLPADLALRLGGHVGPVFPTHDPVLDSLAFMGSHVSRTARVEPVTPPSVVYVTEAFAAALVLEGDSEFACEYVGRMPAAKDYGELRMYRLRRRVSVPR